MSYNPETYPHHSYCYKQCGQVYGLGSHSRSLAATNEIPIGLFSSWY